MTALTYPDNGQLSHITKEAVAAAILHRTYNSLRGAGPQGRVIYREKPSKVLHTQFLLPRRKPSTIAASYLEKDDVSSPAHIGTVGLTFQIANRHDKTIRIRIHAHIYVRILPSVSDLTARAVVFRLSKDARSTILRHRRDALRRAEEQNKAILGEEGRKSPAWLPIKNAATETAEYAALAELGISRSALDGLAKQEAVVSLLPEGDELPVGDDPAVKQEPELESDAGAGVVADVSDTTGAAIDGERPAGRGDSTLTGDSDTLKVFEFVVLPGAVNAPPDILIEREQIPQKWFQLPVDLGALEIDLSKNFASIDPTVAEFNSEMQRRVQQVIDDWERDADPDTGGLLWAFPAGSGTRSRLITPLEVVGWGNTLGTLRTNRRVARPQILPVLEYENLEDPLHPDQRTIRIILANESDLIDPKQAEAKECDASLYQTELSVEFPDDLHRPIALERIEPSYRYNQYLTHDALGINCGVRRRRLVDAHILETTALPIYFQPLIKQFEISPAPEFSKLGATDGGLAILKGLLTAFDNWLDTVIASKPFENALDPILDAADYAREKAQFETVDLPRWRAERSAMARGVGIIEKALTAQRGGKKPTDQEVIPLTAWRFMNQTFEEFWRRKNRNVKEWRLFQIAFVIAQIPAVVSRLEGWKGNPQAFEAQDDREATLLYFSTGGGKSESFFGLLVYSLAFDRLRGKTRGITAVVRYPLRLLTSQQAYRLSQVLAAAQRIRWAWQDQNFDLSGHLFEIGFWVGGNNTPNNQNARGVSDIPRLQDGWDEVLLRRGDYAIYLKKWSRLPSCPFCYGLLQADDGKRYSTIGLRRLPDGPEERLAHFCFNKQCDWNQKHGASKAPYPLPIYIMDSDIYAHAPSVLLGTVDKLALIGQSARTIARVLGMFGFPAWHHVASNQFVSPYTREQFRKGPQALGCEPVFPFYDDGAKLFLDPYPLLEIQDEAHLLEVAGNIFRPVRNHVSARVTIVGAAPRPIGRLSEWEYEAAAHRRARRRRLQTGAADRSDLPAFLSYFFHDQERISTKVFMVSSISSGDTVRDASESAEHRTPTRRAMFRSHQWPHAYGGNRRGALDLPFNDHTADESVYRGRRRGALASAKGNGGCAAGRYFSDRSSQCAARREDRPLSYCGHYQSKPHRVALCDEQKGRR